MANERGGGRRRPGAPPPRPAPEPDFPPDSESPEQLRRAAWAWLKPKPAPEPEPAPAPEPEPVAEPVAEPEPAPADASEAEPKRRRAPRKKQAPADASGRLREIAAAWFRKRRAEAPSAVAAPAPAVEAEPAAPDAAEPKRRRAPRKKPAPLDPVERFRASAAAWWRKRAPAGKGVVPVGAGGAPANGTGENADAPGTGDEDLAKHASGTVARAHLKGVLEALIFASESPLSSRELAKVARAEHRLVAALIAELKAEYMNRGIRLDEIAGGYVFRTSPAFAPFVREQVAKKPVKMTRAQVETLAIVAYRQPITRPEIDDVRGVDSGAVLKSLLERDLVRILGKKDEPGRPMLYGTTGQFLEFFGLKALSDLPTLREFTELTDESRRTYEREMGEEPPEASAAETNATDGGLMGGEGSFRRAGAEEAATEESGREEPVTPGAGAAGAVDAKDVEDAAADTDEEGKRMSDELDEKDADANEQDDLEEEETLVGGEEEGDEDDEIDEDADEDDEDEDEA